MCICQMIRCVGRRYLWLFICLTIFIVTFSNWIADWAFASISCIFILCQHLFTLRTKELWNQLDIWFRLIWIIFFRVLTYASWLGDAALELSGIPIVNLVAILTFVGTNRIFTEPILIGLNTFLKVFICYLLVLYFKKIVFTFDSSSKRTFTVNNFLCRWVSSVVAAALWDDVELLHYLRLGFSHRLLI